MKIEHHYVELNGIRIHVARAGKGPCLVLLHGFPEFWFSWRNQILAFAKHFMVIAPDLRGFGESEKPEGIGAYDQNILVDDLVALKEHYSPRKPIDVIGHDWGAALAYLYAIKHPSHISKLVTLSFPHPAQFKKMLKQPAQMMRSWYMFLFQIPFLPEHALAAFDFSLLRLLFFRAWRANPATMPDQTIKQYTEAIGSASALGSAINYYRAMFKHKSGSNRAPVVQCPTLLLWGEHDRLASADSQKMMSEPSEYFTSEFRFEIVPGAGHWLQQEAPQLVNRRIGEFLSANRKRAMK